MRATLGFLICLPLLAGCGSQAEPIAVQYASYDDCLLDKLGRNQTTAAVEIITQACKSKYKKAPPVPSVPPTLTRHHDGEVGGADVWAEFDEATKAEILNSPIVHGNACTDDCSGHEAGYQWAEEHDISHPGDCGGNSGSFIEGCEAWAEENLE